MDHATGAMGSLLLKLGGLLTDEYKLQAGVKEDVGYMKRELTSMYAAMHKVGDVPRDQLDEQVRIWADEVRDLSYRMEDSIDKFLVRVQGAPAAVKPGKIKRLMKKMGELFTKGKTRHEIADEFKGIKALVREAAERRDRYRVHEVVADPVGTTTVDPRLLALYKDQKDLVGIDGALSELTSMLGGDLSKQLKIISIFGFGGLGKTTLAKALYDKLREQYDCSAFVLVGRKPSVQKILNDILYDINKQKYADLDERQLINKLRELLKNKRYFIVIDDIRDIETWDRIRCALVNDSCASRIITTTRILDVATNTGEVYKLKPLSADLSEELFNTRLFGGPKFPYDPPREVYAKFLHKCGGVPLAIITIASLLVGKPMEVWSKVYSSIGFGYEDNKDVENTRKILLFSYYDLPSHLRTCLLYLTIYPEDYLIKKDKLIWKWVGEGFVHKEKALGLFESGERIFNELLNKSMIQPVETPYHGIVIGCRVHDMVLDMIHMLAKEESFVTVVDSDEQDTSSRGNARRLAVGFSGRFDGSMWEPQIRSFNAMSIADQFTLPSCFDVLRVLSFEYGTISLEHIGELVHLRYFHPPRDIPKLPEEIGDLKFLQVLDLSGCYTLKELPRSIGLLIQLKCLNAEQTIIKATDWLGNLTSLEELCLGSVYESSKFVTKLGKLTELRKLRITGVLQLNSPSSMKAWVESVVKLQQIQVIDIRHFSSGLFDVITNWESYNLPPTLRVLHLGVQLWAPPGLLAKINVSLLPNLSHLSVHVGTDPDLEIFGQFPKLITLKLHTRIGLHHEVMGGKGAFPMLRVFNTYGTLGLFVEGNMPNLESLEFRVYALPGPSSDGKIVDYDFGSLVNLPLLQQVTVHIWHDPEADIEQLKEAVRQAIDIHPNRPRLELASESCNLDFWHQLQTIQEPCISASTRMKMKVRSTPGVLVRTQSINLRGSLSPGLLTRPQQGGRSRQRRRAP